MFHSFVWSEQKNKTNIKKHGVGLKAGISVRKAESCEIRQCNLNVRR